MKAEEAWRPSKFVLDGGRWTGSKDPRVLGLGSRLTATLLLRAYEHLIGAHARGDLVDYGCGSAPLYGLYRPRVTSVVCVDWPASRHDIRHADHEADLNAGTPLPPDSADTILCTDVLEHLWAPEAALADIARILRPGGTLLLTVPFLYWIHEAPHDYHRYTEFALRRLCAGAGLDVVDLRTYGGLPEVLGDLLLKGAARRPWLARLLEPVVRGCLALRPMRGPGTATRFPLGYALAARKPAAR